MLGCESIGILPLTLTFIIMQLAKLVGLTLLVVILTIVSSLISIPAQKKTFHVVTSPQFGDVPLCSVEEPSRVLNVSDILLQIEMMGLLTMMSTIPIHVLCADHCSGEQGCTGFNYKQDVGQCQLYKNVSKSCSVQKSCTHYSMNWSEACQGSAYGDCIIDALSWGFDDTTKHNGYISVSRNVNSTRTTNVHRGFNIVELDVIKCSMSDVHNFDTCNWGSGSGSTNNSQRLADYINALPTSTVLIGITADEANSDLEMNGKNALLSVGVDVTELQSRSKVAFVAQVGRPAVTVMQMDPPESNNTKITVNVRGKQGTPDVLLIRQRV